ncbi:MAG: tetraacyldisaccharide 4'-kinase [Glaciecola sp.]
MLQKAWFTNSKWIWILLPLSFLFWALSSMRRCLFRWGVLSSKNCSLPVVVVGNISIGGNGKTPLCIALVNYLQEQGYTPAILSRGYGGSTQHFPRQLHAQASAHEVGDEPALMFQRLGCVVVIDPIRSRGCEYIAQHTQANIIICDDGLQHYAMQRDLEICVMDRRGLGNAKLLPMGPLREGAWRLKTVDACVVNAHANDFADFDWLRQYNDACYNMQLQPSAWVNVTTGERISLATINKHLLNQRVAIAGIGDPKRFFDTLDTLNVRVNHCVPYADHHAFSQSDIQQNMSMLMTEKDAVKVRAFANNHCWYLEVNAQLPSGFFDAILQPLIKNNKLKANA